MSAALAASPEQQRAFRLSAAVSAGLSTSPIPGYTVASIWEGFEPPRYLVKRLLGPGEVTVLFGESGHFKSAVAIDLALCVASGTGYHGTKTRKAGVLYVPAEGHGGIRKRIRAWLLAHGVDSAAEQPALYVTKAGANLIGNPEQLRATVESAAKVLGVPIELMVLDTLAQNFGPGDEDRSGDMGLAVDGARQSAPEASILLVHHTGHSDKNRERGSYALIAAADYRLQATYNDVARLIELKWLKAKDDERPEPLVFEWKSVGLEWQDEDGEELSSVVLERLDGASMPQQGPRSVGLGKNQDTALRSLRTLYARNRKNLEADGRNPAEARILVDGWRNDCQRKGINAKRWPEVLNVLLQRNLVAVDGPHVAIIEAVA